MEVSGAGMATILAIRHERVNVKVFGPAHIILVNSFITMFTIKINSFFIVGV
jgi:hypothetical protein